MKINKFEDLKIWKASIRLTKEIYKITSSVCFKKDFPLRDQLRRSIVSISSNIVEGFEKNNNNELIRFLKIAKGSAGEARNQVYVCSEINYIEKNEFIRINNLLLELINQIGKFIVYLENKKRNGQFKKH